MTVRSPASRLALLQDLARRRNLTVSGEVLTWLADNVAGSVRRLEGAVGRLETLVKLDTKAPDVAAVAATGVAQRDGKRL